MKKVLGLLAFLGVAIVLASCSRGPAAISKNAVVDTYKQVYDDKGNASLIVSFTHNNNVMERIEMRVEVLLEEDDLPASRREEAKKVIKDMIYKVVIPELEKLSKLEGVAVVDDITDSNLFYINISMDPRVVDIRRLNELLSGSQLDGLANVLMLSPDQLDQAMADGEFVKVSP